MSRAFDEARAAAARGEVPVGAVIVRQGEIIAASGNHTVAARDIGPLPASCLSFST
jgi:tRNA(adenine34) deaminase